jgi:hypothetical protein
MITPSNSNQHNSSNYNTNKNCSTTQVQPDLRLELLRRLQVIETYTGIPCCAWNWSVLHYLDTISSDLWTLIVYAGILLTRTRYFTRVKNPTNPNTNNEIIETQILITCMTLINAALSISLKFLHDGGYHTMNISCFEAEMNLANRINWNFLIGKEEYYETSRKWFLGDDTCSSA